jgi:hypothetical protein
MAQLSVLLTGALELDTCDGEEGGNEEVGTGESTGSKAANESRMAGAVSPGSGEDARPAFCKAVPLTGVTLWSEELDA